MRCSNCPYMVYADAESNEMCCFIFGDEIPEEYERKDEEGCKCNEKQLAKFNRENEKAWLDDIKGFMKYKESESRNEYTN